MRNCAIIPAFATLDEAVFYALEDVQDTFNRVLEETGIEELGRFLVSEAVLLEADEEEAASGEDGKAKVNIKEKVATAVDKAITALKSLYGKFIQAIHNAQVKFRTKVADEQMKMIDKKLDALKAAEGADAVLVKTYAYSGLEAAIKGEGSVWGAVKGMIDDLEGENTTASENKTDIIAEIRGEEKTYAVKDLNKKVLGELYAVATDDNMVKKQLAMALKADEMRLSALKKDLKGNKEGIKGVNEACRELIKTRNVTLQMYRERMHAAQSVLMKVAGKRAPKEEKEDKKAAEAQPVNAAATFQEEIDSLFDWGSLI